MSDRGCRYDLRAFVRGAIEQYLPAGKLQKLKEIEAMEREKLRQFTGAAA